MDRPDITWTHVEKSICPNCGWVGHSVGHSKGVRFVMCRECGHRREEGNGKKTG